MSLIINCYPKGLYDENTYLITDSSSGLRAVIDPGFFGEKVKNDIGDAGLLKYILLTHAHHDHFLAIDQYREEYPDAVFAASAGDRVLLKKSGCPEPDRLLSEDDVITLGETLLKVIETPGHTAGGICFATDKEIFTGDTLFRLSVGRTDLETGDWNALVHSVKEKLFSLDENLKVYPGHGMPSSIGFEKKENPFV